MCVVMELFSILTTSNTGRTRPEYKLYGLEIIVALTLSIYGDISSLITSGPHADRQRQSAVLIRVCMSSCL